MTPSEINQLTPDGYGGDFEMITQVGAQVGSASDTDATRKPGQFDGRLYTQREFDEAVNQRNEALEALLSMWEQYCPLPYTHMFMGAGEQAEEVLDRYGLLRGKGEANYEGLAQLNRIRGEE